MRIAYATHQYPPAHVGGTEVYTHGLARRAVGAGHDVVVLSYIESPSNRTEDFGSSTRHHEGIEVREFAHNLSLAKDVALAEYDNAVATEWVERQLEEWRPDVVHVTHPMKLGSGTLGVARRLGAPTVATLTDYWFLCPRHTLLTWEGRVCDGPTDWQACLACTRDLHHIAGRRREQRSVRARPEVLRDEFAQIDRVIAFSPFVVEIFQANGFDVSSVEVVPHGIEPDAACVSSTRPHQATTRFALLSSLVPFKGAHIAIDAFRREPDLDASLLVYGVIPSGEYGRSIQEASVADPRIELRGSYAPDALGTILGDVDYLLFPALWYENNPLVVQTALRTGVPAIVSRIGTLTTMIEDDADGWTVTPGDVGAWGAALVRAVQQRDRWPRVPRQLPDAADHARRVLAIYDELTTMPR